MTKNKKANIATAKEPGTKHMVTPEDIDNNPELTAAGINVGDENVNPEETEEEDNKQDVIDASETTTDDDEEIAKYFELYPEENTFHRTSDMQVFTSHNLALTHQKTLDGQNTFQTFKRK